MNGGVDMVVVLELRHGEEVVPVVLPFVHKEPEVLIQLLIDIPLSVRRFEGAMLWKTPTLSLVSGRVLW